MGRGFKFVRSESEYLSNVENLSVGDKDFSMSLVCVGITGMNKDEKRCSRCRFTLPLTDFYVNNTMKDRRARICKVCERDLKREAREAKRFWNEPSKISR